MFEGFKNKPIRRDIAHTPNETRDWQRKNTQEGEEKKHRVLAFIQANPARSIEDIIRKFNLCHDVVRSNDNNEVVAVGFFADETYSVKILELYMPYSAVVKLP